MSRKRNSGFQSDEQRKAVMAQIKAERRRVKKARRARKRRRAKKVVQEQAADVAHRTGDQYKELLAGAAAALLFGASLKAGADIYGFGKDKSKQAYKTVKLHRMGRDSKGRFK